MVNIMLLLLLIIFLGLHVFCFSHKSEVFKLFKHFCKRVKKEFGFSIIKICSDHGDEFENENFIELRLYHGIIHTFSAPRTPQQNGILERRNRTL